MSPFFRGIFAAAIALLVTKGANSAEPLLAPAGLGPKAIGSILKNCAQFNESTRLTQRGGIKNDHLGRPATIIAPNGLEYVIQYSSDKDKMPASIVGNGVNVSIGYEIAPREKIEKYLANRVRNYRLVKSICAIGSGGSDTGKSASLTVIDSGGEGWELGIPSEYYDSAFWAGAWEPTFDGYAAAATQSYNNYNQDWAAREAARRLECSATCNNACDTTSDGVAMVGCSAVGWALIDFGFTAKEGAFVLGVCQVGTFVGKYYCKNRTCPNLCGG